MEAQREATRASKGEGRKIKEQITIYHRINVERYRKAQQLHQTTRRRHQKRTEEESISHYRIRWSQT